MTPLHWILIAASLAGPTDLDTDRMCASEDRVAMAPSLDRRIRTPSSCPGVVSESKVAAFMKAFAVLERELAEDDYAEQLVRHVEARWLLLRDGSVYDGAEKAFVETSPFAPQPPTPAEAAYLAGFRALKGKRYDEARTRLTECLEHDADHAGCHWELGWVHWVAEEWPEAAEQWEAVERLDPDHPDVDDWLPKARKKADADADAD